jgi:hypothetical protein
LGCKTGSREGRASAGASRSRISHLASRVPDPVSCIPKPASRIPHPETRIPKPVLVTRRVYIILEPGNKLLIAHRRLFDKDEPRFFAGEVLDYQAGVVKVSGYSFVREMTSGKVLRKDDVRIKLISITSGTVLLYQLPDETEVSAVAFVSHDGDTKLTDGKHVNMNMSELPHAGHL